jgi:pimeloyl-ACP methyl ester carboxylesterase
MRLLLLHAYPFDPSMWEPQLPLLAAHDLVVPRLYDLSGETVEAWAAGLEPELGEGAVVVGASMGGYLALELARRAPEQVQALVLVGAKATADTPERRAGREATLAELAAGRLPDDLPAPVSAEELARATRLLRDRPDQTATVCAFDGPLLVCVGADDEILSVQEASSLAASAPDGSAVVFPGAGHLPCLEDPEAFNPVLVDFLARCT